MEIKLSKPFAANTAVDEFDVRQLKKVLNRLGYYQPYDKTGVTGIPDTGIFEALKSFQRDQNLTPTGTAKPGDETIKHLNQSNKKAAGGYYIWRTVEDDKVRAAHAQYNRTVRAWSDAPDPGDDFNCRCWAEPVDPVILRGISNAELLNFFSKSEGNVQYMYLDDKGNVTIGVGMLLSNEDAATKLPFIKQGKPATPEEIRAAYRKIKTAQSRASQGRDAFNPQKHAEFSNIRIAKETGFENLKRRLPEDLKSLRRKFKDFDSFPLGARQALLDMEFNIGPTKFNRQKWPSLFAAIDKKDWKKAAQESNRKDVQLKRNKDTYDLFISAGQR